MKILYDHQIFSYQEYGGVSRYFYELISRMPQDMWDISIKFSNNYLLEELNKIKPLKYSTFLPGKNFFKKGRIMLELGKPYSLYAVKQSNFDVLHLTHYESYCISKTSKPIVVTYHDKLFSSYAYNTRTIREQEKCFRRADAVICISENTKKDFLNLFNYPEEKTHVIYHGINTLPKIEINKDVEPERKYILYIGGRAQYKNFTNLAIAFSRLAAKDKNLYLCCTGKKFDDEESKLLERLKINNKTISNFVDDQELAKLYTYAQCFVFPSKYEGFGMPILEAWDHGCPVCCSNAHCFPEIAHDAAEYFDPEEPDSIEKAICNVIYSKQRRQELIQLGYQRKTFFSWDKTVSEHIKLYKSLIE